MLRFWSFFLYFASLALLLGSAVPAVAKKYSADVTCDELTQLPPAIVYQIPHWLPGWWGARYHDPHINGMRTHLLVSEMAKQCQRNLNIRILDTVRSVTSMPPVPDNALTIRCEQYINSREEWQSMVFHWLQGYTAYKNGSTLIDENFLPALDKFYDFCVANPRMTTQEAFRRIDGSRK